MKLPKNEHLITDALVGIGTQSIGKRTSVEFIHGDHTQRGFQSQFDYNALSLNDTDEPAVSEFDIESECSIVWYESSSLLAQYLTKKGAGIDSDIKWGSIAPSPKSTTKVSGKRSSTGDSISAPIHEPRKRRATAGGSNDGMRTFKHENAAVSGTGAEQCDAACITVGGSLQSVQGMLSRAATLSRLDEHASDASDGHSCCHAADPACGRPAAFAGTIHRVPSTESSAPCTASLHSISDLRSLGSSPASMRLSTHTAPHVTILCLDIKGFTPACAAMPAARVGEWVAAFYEQVDAAAAAHGVTKAEVRGDCCVCVAGAAGAVPSRAFAPAHADPHSNQATRMLAFAAALHAALATLSAGGAATAARMGIAAGAASFLVSDAGAGGGASFVSVHGDAAALAARMESLAAPGAARVHRSAALRWAAEARRAPPPTACVDCGGGGGLQHAAVFDCAAGAFRPAADAAASAPASASLFRCESAPL
jgi:class 3 adenylate cyclase